MSNCIRAYPSEGATAEQAATSSTQTYLTEGGTSLTCYAGTATLDANRRLLSCTLASAAYLYRPGSGGRPGVTVLCKAGGFTQVDGSGYLLGRTLSQTTDFWKARGACPTCSASTVTDWLSCQAGGNVSFGSTGTLTGCASATSANTFWLLPSNQIFCMTGKPATFFDAVNGKFVFPAGSVKTCVMPWAQWFKTSTGDAGCASGRAAMFDANGYLTKCQ